MAKWNEVLRIAEAAPGRFAGLSAFPASTRGRHAGVTQAGTDPIEAGIRDRPRVTDRGRPPRR